MDNHLKESNIFKTCPCCSLEWSSRETFLADPDLVLIGYQVEFENLEAGMLFFNHKTEPCQSTITLMMGDFLELYTGKTYIENKALSEECPRYCLDEKQLSRCDALCECAFVRETIQIILKKHEEAKQVTNPQNWTDADFPPLTKNPD